MTNKKIILDLCGGTGSWSKPYRDAGYEVHNITLPRYDIRDFYLKDTDEIYGILAAPPCTHFSVSGAQYWKAKDADGRTFNDVSILTACLRIIATARPIFWAIENPVGRMRKLLGEPQLIFDPCDYGDPYTKKTLLWGVFNKPVKNPVTPIRANKQGSWIQGLGGKSDRTKELRSMTPQGFAQAFFQANK